jgi:hypothetical protein
MTTWNSVVDFHVSFQIDHSFYYYTPTSAHIRARAVSGPLLPHAHNQCRLIMQHCSCRASAAARPPPSPPQSRASSRGSAMAPTPSALPAASTTAARRADALRADGAGRPPRRRRGSRRPRRRRRRLRRCSCLPAVPSPQRDRDRQFGGWAGFCCRHRQRRRRAAAGRGRL